MSLSTNLQHYGLLCMSVILFTLVAFIKNKPAAYQAHKALPTASIQYANKLKQIDYSTQKTNLHSQKAVFMQLIADLRDSFLAENKVSSYDELADIQKVELIEHAAQAWKLYIFDKKGFQASRPHVYSYVTETLKINRLAVCMFEHAKYDIFASFTLAQGALETGWGAKSAAGTHGIKARGAEKGKLVITSEVLTLSQINALKQDILSKRKIGNGLYRVQICDRFIEFDNEWQSYRHRSKVFANRPIYSNYRAYKTVYGMVQYIHKQGYATDPDYTTKITKIIRQYSFNWLDEAVQIIKS